MNSATKAAIGVILLLFQSILAQQSNFKFERFTINNGLSNNSVNCVLQTKDGYLWIATKDGLNRFDGQSFKVFKKNASQKNSLPENYIMFLYEDSKNILWVGAWGFGLCKYDPIQESFIRVDKTNNNDFVQCIEEDSDGNIWYGTTLNGLKKYNPKTNSITVYNSSSPAGKKIPATNVTSIHFENRNTLWIATWGSGLIKFNLTNGRFEQFKKDNGKNCIADNLVWWISNAKGNLLYISTDSGLDLFDTGNNSFTHHPGISKENQQALTTSVRQALTDHTGKLWIGTYNYQGMYVVSNHATYGSSFVRLLNEDDDPYSLICQRIRWLYEDKQKNIWIGTEDGLNKLPKTKDFEQFKYMPSREYSLGGRVVSSIYEGRNNILWVGFGGNGFDKINLKTNQITHFKSGSPGSNTLNVSDVISLIEDSEGIIWIGTNSGGLNRYNPKTNSFKSYMTNSANPHSIKSNWVQQILETSDGQLLVGTNDGLQIFDRNLEKFELFSPEVNSGSSKIPNLFSVNSLYEDKQKNIWIGTWLDGLFRYDPTVKRIFHYSPSTQYNSISGNKISSIIQDSKENIWIGTFSNGLNRFDKSNGKLTYYNTSNGLPNDCVFGILEDAKGLIWISTMKGLAKLNPANGVFRVYDVEDGLVHNQFNWHAYHKNTKGKMYFGGIEGFVSFFPDSIKKEEKTPNVVLTSFKVFDKEAPLPRSLPTTHEIILEHNQNFFSIDFTALDLTPVYKHQFAYMLEGIDPQWVNSGPRTTAFYTDIKHGTYRFLVRATNADGVWGAPTSLSIKIYPAWWNTWWFRIIMFGLIVGIIFAGYRYRINQLLKIEKIRFSIASDLHDEIGSNLSSISVDSQSLMLSPTLNNSEKELSVDISKTAKATVDAMRDIIWFINPKNDVNEDIIFKMKQTAAKLLSNLEWCFEASPDARLDSFNLDVRRNIFLLYKEVLTNVINHSKAKKCTIVISGSPKHFSLSIEDDGQGFDLKDFKGSTGIRSMEARALKMNAKLNIVSSLNNGT
ncbi:MAG: two-component regulator propeller domain-containing protein, partial [Ignavibacteria bacterium]|nr:two-component regulator propeller domain-containing protein [Ignavibacteria bacterium]